MKKWQSFLLLVSVFGILIFNVKDSHAKVYDQEASVVHAILFYSPTCGHCHMVITETLSPLIDTYGNQLQIMGINVASPEGQEIYQSFLEAWQVPDTMRGVPTLVVGGTYLVGSGDIPAQFPGILREGLQEGGIDWPEIPGLEEIVAQALQPTQTPSEEIQNGELVATTSPTMEMTMESSSVEETEKEIGIITETESPTQIPQEETSSPIIIPEQEQITLADRFQRDLAGNIMAVVVLIGMIISIIWVLVRILRPVSSGSKDLSWTIPGLSIIGIVVAGYLSFVEVTQSQAVCGPIGDCNTVQQSPYAILFGFLPVGILGLLGYLAIIVAWLFRKFGPEKWRGFFTLSIWGMALFGTIFSIYLTFLEPFVIGATCAWCVTSAIIITVQLWVSSDPVRELWNESEEDILSEDHKNIAQKSGG